MVDQQLGVHAEKLVEKVLVVIFPGAAQRTAGHVAHGMQPDGFQLSGVAGAHPPKIRQGPMIPEVLAVGKLVQLRNANAVRIRRDPLSPDVHGDLAQIQIRPDPCGGGDAGLT